MILTGESRSKRIMTCHSATLSITNTNRKIYITMVKPVVMYGSETWPVTMMDMKRLNTWRGKY